VDFAESGADLYLMSIFTLPAHYRYIPVFLVVLLLPVFFAQSSHYAALPHTIFHVADEAQDLDLISYPIVAYLSASLLLACGFAYAEGEAASGCQIFRVMGRQSEDLQGSEWSSGGPVHNIVFRPKLKGERGRFAFDFNGSTKV